MTSVTPLLSKVDSADVAGQVVSPSSLTAPCTSVPKLQLLERGLVIGYGQMRSYVLLLLCGCPHTRLLLPDFQDDLHSDIDYSSGGSLMSSCVISCWSEVSVCLNYFFSLDFCFKKLILLFHFLYFLPFFLLILKTP